ncbi:hypothetical protein QTG56_25480 (plasmid) [Rossellomorea sp. AcN35-11]|nr:hypothetical protein [Rossellomorea aquimaris]WJV31968.1 hypothetical protein QTG56_25480 [Rossellomorea sp. AcN35-11]
MEHEEYFCELLIDKTKEISRQNKYKYIQQVSEWIARVFLSETRKEVTHDFDPPWDYSGELIDTNEPFQLKDYTSLESFTENEYNGISEASFVSGCGLLHKYYTDELDELTDEWVVDQLISAVIELRREHPDRFNDFIEGVKEEGEEIHTAKEITQLILMTDIIGDFIVFDLPTELSVEVGKMNLSYLVKRSTEIVKEKIREEELQAKKQSELKKRKTEKDKCLAEDIWKELNNRYKLRHQKVLKDKIDRTYFKSEVVPILIGMINDGRNKEDIKVLSEFYSGFLSNSVSGDIAQGRYI